MPLDTSTETFDPVVFSEHLRQLAVADQEGANKSLIWKNEGQEFSAYPEHSESCLAAIAKMLKENPKQWTEILEAIEVFINRSKGMDGEKGSAIGDKRTDVCALLIKTQGKVVFYKRLFAKCTKLVSESEKQVEPSVPRAVVVARKAITELMQRNR